MSATAYVPTDEDNARYFDSDRPIVKRLMQSRAKRILIDGPYGTGKTKLALEKVRCCLLNYPKSRWLMVRSVRKWLSNTALVTWEEKVVFRNDLIPDRIQRSGRSEYRFRNGSTLVVGGLDDASAVLSSEYDGAYLNEANEVRFDVVDMLDKRLRYGRMPYQQLIMDCNPAGPTHWLHHAFTTGWCERLPMRHTDNPAIYRNDGKLTKWGAAYMARLEDMTGVRRERYLHGKWVQSEGVVYDRYDARVHLIRKSDLPSNWQNWPRVWCWDFGFNDPLVWQCWAIDPDGRLVLVHELYRVQMLPEAALELIQPVIEGEPSPEAILCDHDRAERERIEQILKRGTEAATKGIHANIQAVSERLKLQGDGKPRVYICEDALIHAPDERLVGAQHPVNTAAEFEAYIWKKTPGEKGRDEPLDRFNHGMDCLGYTVRWADDRSDLGSRQYGAEMRSPLLDLGDNVFLT